MSKQLMIYIASPYTGTDLKQSVRAQIDVFHEIMDKGHFAYAPLLMHYAERVRPRPYHDWIEHCLDMVLRCDVLLRLSGSSYGAELEERKARVGRIPVITYEELFPYLNKQNS